MTRKLTFVGGKKPQLRKSNKRSWSKAKADKFLAVLAETCNVSEAVRQSGIPMTVAYRRRKMDARFRAEWLAMIAEAYSMLELLLLDRAFNGSEKVVVRRDGSEERMREYPNHIGLQLLRMHRETAMEAEAEMGVDELAELRERLVNKLQRLKRRDEQQETRFEQLRDDAHRGIDPEGGERGAAAGDHR